MGRMLWPNSDVEPSTSMDVAVMDADPGTQASAPKNEKDPLPFVVVVAQ